MNERRFFTVVAGLVLFVMVGGCGDEANLKKANTISTDGKVLVNGKPFGPAKLSFVHASDKSAPGIEAQVKEDGTFTVLSYKAGDNKPAGKYQVILTEDPEVMSMNGVPPVKPLTVDIQTPDEGTPLKLEIKFVAKKGKVSTGGPDPDAGTPGQNSPGGI